MFPPLIRRTVRFPWNGPATSVSPRTLMPARRPRPSAFSFTPVLSTKWAMSMRAIRLPIGWSRSANVASPSRLPPFPVHGTPRGARGRESSSALISSTLLATWTSRPRSSAHSASWMVRSLCSAPSPAFNRSPRRSGGRQTNTKFRASLSSIRWTAREPIFSVPSPRCARS